MPRADGLFRAKVAISFRQLAVLAGRPSRRPCSFAPPPFGGFAFSTSSRGANRYVGCKALVRSYEVTDLHQIEQSDISTCGRYRGPTRGPREPQARGDLLAGGLRIVASAPIRLAPYEQRLEEELDCRQHVAAQPQGRLMPRQTVRIVAYSIVCSFVLAACSVFSSGDRGIPGLSSATEGSKQGITLPPAYSPTPLPIPTTTAPPTLTPVPTVTPEPLLPPTASSTPTPPIVLQPGFQFWAQGSGAGYAVQYPIDRWSEQSGGLHHRTAGACELMPGGGSDICMSGGCVKSRVTFGGVEFTKTIVRGSPVLYWTLDGNLGFIVESGDDADRCVVDAESVLMTLQAVNDG